MRRMLVISALLLLAADASNASMFYLKSPQAECLLCGPLCGGPCQLFFNVSLPVYELLVWVRPDGNGVIGGCLKVDLPANVLVQSVTENSLITSSTGSIESGVSFALSECRYSEFWTHSVAMVIIDDSHGFISLSAHPGLGLTALSCEPGTPACPAGGNGVYYGVNGTFATKSTSWGAIKSLFGQ
ncbi:MAG: hypothetical protein NTW97_04840 [Candidatus Krumholzibacteria bacterium]|nr:hypothetical protein [Candidatus Krumholzibacteria bacterium]